MSAASSQNRSNPNPALTNDAPREKQIPFRKFPTNQFKFPTNPIVNSRPGPEYSPQLTGAWFWLRERPTRPNRPQRWRSSAAHIGIPCMLISAGEATPRRMPKTLRRGFSNVFWSASSCAVCFGKEGAFDHFSSRRSIIFWRNTGNGRGPKSAVEER